MSINLLEECLSCKDGCCTFSYESCLFPLFLTPEEKKKHLSDYSKFREKELLNKYACEILREVNFIPKYY